MKKPEIIEMGVGDIVPYEHNPRKNEEAVDKVAASIAEFGFKVPIIVDKDNVIVTGHTRLKAALKLGLKTVPCIKATDLTDEQVKAFRLADNKVAEFSDWDFSMLAAELNELKEAGYEFDLTEFGFDEVNREEYNHIDDLLEDGFGVDSSQTAPADIFTVSFNFPVEKREAVARWLAQNSKEYVVNLIIQEAESHVD